MSSNRYISRKSLNFALPICSCYLHACAHLHIPCLWLLISELNCICLLQTYKSKKEAAPKAAFQFGVKVSDGRKGHRELGTKAREQKFNNQLNQIQRKLEKDGGDYSAAFAPSMETGAGSSGAAKKRRI